MQTLYTLSTSDEPISNGDAQKILQQHLAQTKSLLIYTSWFLTQVLQYAEKYAQQKASKHLPTAEDLNINTKLSGNLILWQFLESEDFKKEVSNEKPSRWGNDELVKKTYLKLINTDTYKNYIGIDKRDKAEDKKMAEYVLSELMINNEDFISHIEEVFSNWDDDGEGVIQLISSFIGKASSVQFNDPIGNEKTSFAKDLLQTVIEKSEHLQTIIVPKLKNWDPERIALLDMLMMKMGVAEFLYFDTIPPKVTINEYIDLAKDYSTVQSGQFVNGILDNIHKELVQEGKMEKREYKKNS